ncbi:glycoside hydrolase family 88 protein [Amanita thiersii Skay4041]|uniref:Glycoside hydrolase family 88 protein n=1 Tax=Amanita thiersii Skay4041 TaxID=703135 RepID=A0A2A9NXB7_9AGAR|nr:glycoside hydrolase family 88 protein [Amanita thiersii Skay4041]
MFSTFCSLLALSLAVSAAQSSVPQELFSTLIRQKVLATYNALPQPTKYPQYTDMSIGRWQFFSPDTWTSGFFPVTAYALNTRKHLCLAGPQDPTDWLSIGRAASSALIPLESANHVGHDVGFLSFPFIEELVINSSNQTARTAINAFAKDLAARFSPVVGCTRSWDAPDPDFQVIIDNMMNLEVLFQSALLTGNQTLRNIAISHADTTMLNHIRNDGSTWHVIDYDSNTGAVTRKRTAQGFSDNSTWSRGQAWAIYGFANMYRNTRDPKYFDTAKRLAGYFLTNLPTDGIVPWDFNGPLTPPPRPADSSAATIAANGLLMMSQLETDPTAAKRWSDAAIQLLSNITTLAWNPTWQSLLSNGTVNWPQGNFLTGTVYGDYYFVRAGNELVSMGLAAC